jgi:hypothetical protein
MTDHLTTDRNDPRLTHGVDTEPTPQAEAYLILSESERAKGFVRPYREAYTHVGAPGPTHPLRDLTAEERERYAAAGYVSYEEYPEGLDIVGSFWTQARLDNVGKGCGTSTKMGRALSETYARDPSFYGATYCVGCSRHLPVAEFTWDADGSRVGS